MGLTEEEWWISLHFMIYKGSESQIITSSIFVLFNDLNPLQIAQEKGKSLVEQGFTGCFKISFLEWRIYRLWGFCKKKIPNEHWSVKRKQAMFWPMDFLKAKKWDATGYINQNSDWLAYFEVSIG